MDLRQLFVEHWPAIAEELSGAYPGSTIHLDTPPDSPADNDLLVVYRGALDDARPADPAGWALEEVIITTFPEQRMASLARIYKPAGR